MKNAWKWIEAKIYLKTSESESQKIIAYCKGEFLINPIDIADSFNNFFCPVAPNIQSTIKLAFKPFHHYLTNPCVDSFLISTCTKKKILVIMSSFDNKRVTGINGIPLKSLD